MDQSVLHRMTRQKVVPATDVPITSSRAVSMAVARAADLAHAMPVTVQSVGEEVLTLDALEGVLGNDLLLLALHYQGVFAGLAALDLQMRAALIEMQTVGHVLDGPPDARAGTATDAMMATPMVTALMETLRQTTVRTDLEGWADDVTVMGRVASLRAAGLALPDRDYRLIRLTLDLGAGGRQGEMALFLPVCHNTVSVVITDADHPDWATVFRDAVTSAPATLTAELHRFSIPLHRAQAFAVGQTIPLPGCSVGDVKLLAPGGKVMGTARLGQFAGLRAVRLDGVQTRQMSDLTVQTGQNVLIKNDA